MLRRGEREKERKRERKGEAKAREGWRERAKTAQPTGTDSSTVPLQRKCARREVGYSYRVAWTAS